MKIVKPIAITPAQYQAWPTAFFGYTNTTDYAEWSAVTAYVTGDRVIVESLQSQFEAVAPNTNVAPTLLGTTPWLRIGATNAWRPFDRVVSVPFVGYIDSPSSPFDYYHKFQITGILERFNTVAILETNAAFVELFITDQSGVTIHSELVYGADNSEVVDAWSYCFSEIVSQRSFVFDGIDGWGTSSPGASVLITAYSGGNALSGPVTVGEIIIGQGTEIGETKADPTKRLVDYSRKESDDFGNISLVERSYAFEATFDVQVSHARKALVDNLVASIRAVPCLFYPDATEANKGILIFGIEREFSVTYSTPEVVHATLEVQGLT